MISKFHWPHAPEHRLGGQGAYMVTSGTFEKTMLFAGEERLTALCGGLLKYTARHGWHLQAWAVFLNHYHFIASSPVSGAEKLPVFLREFHSRSARWLNKKDGTPGRKVWHNYWESHLTFEASYLARLNYVHQNAVKHNLADSADRYPWCSAGWFRKTASPSFYKTVGSFKTDTIHVEDDFD